MLPFSSFLSLLSPVHLLLLSSLFYCFLIVTLSPFLLISNIFLWFVISIALTARLCHFFYSFTASYAFLRPSKLGLILVMNLVRRNMSTVMSSSDSCSLIYKFYYFSSLSFLSAFSQLIHSSGSINICLEVLSILLASSCRMVLLQVLITCRMVLKRMM